MALGKFDLIEEVRLKHPALSYDGDWLGWLAQRSDGSDLSDLRGSLQRVIKWAGREVVAGNIKQAASAIALAFAVDEAKAMEYLGGEGILRASKNDFRTDAPRAVAKLLLERATALRFSAPMIGYFQSVTNLLEVGKQVMRLNRSLEDFVERHSVTAMKSVVAFVDSLFMLEHDGNPSGSSETLAGYGKEDMAEAASYILHLYDRKVGTSDFSFNFVGESKLSSGLYAKLLIKAAKIRAYLEAEVLVDGFGYRCERRGSRITVIPPTPALEKSIRLGYALRELKGHAASAQRIQAIRDGEVSILSVADDLYQKYGDRLAYRKDFPFPRYVFEYPDHPRFSAAFSHDGFTIEEKLYFQEVLAAEQVTWDELKAFSFEGGVTFEGLVKVNRLFKFLARVASNHLRPRLETEAELVYRSLVPVFAKSKLLAIFGWCVGEEEAKAMLELLSWKSGSSGLVDLQYRSIIDGGNYCMVPLTIAGSTNWYRNLAFTEKRRVTEGLEQDGAVSKLASSLSGATPMVRSEFETKFGKERIEVDVVCRFGDILFLFECKHSLLPCNVFELRTSYKHIRTGAAQLARMEETLSQEGTQVEFYRRLGWDIAPAKEIVTCIVSCNGMFSGLRLDRHPVRGLGELVNMIETGVVTITETSTFEDEKGPGVADESVAEHHLWRGSSPTPEFLREYLVGDLLVKPMFDSMPEISRSFAINGWALEFQTYAFNLAEYADALEKLGAGLHLGVRG